MDCAVCNNPIEMVEKDGVSRPKKPVLDFYDKGIKKTGHEECVVSCSKEIMQPERDTQESPPQPVKTIPPSQSTENPPQAQASPPTPVNITRMPEQQNGLPCPVCGSPEDKHDIIILGEGLRIERNKKINIFRSGRKCHDCKAVWPVGPEVIIEK